MNLTPNDDTSALQDVKQLGLFAAIGSLGYVFWIVGAMEMVERLAYYGVKAVAALYATEAFSKGGLGITATEFGTIMLVWALTQSIVPALTGGLSDRYGYKETIFVSTVIKIIGYLLMAWFHSYWGFFAGALVLATGTAIFKPGIQGTLAKTTNRTNSSVAWGIFYQTVNIGGFLGPLVAGLLRKWEWTYVFYACAAIICANFLLLLTYKEVGLEERLERRRLQKEGKLERKSLIAESFQELRKPHLWIYLLIFSGFWFMFNSLFDVLPLHIRDWVDTSDIIATIFSSGESDNAVINFFFITNEAGTEIQPEGLVNINAGIIMLTCFLFAGISAKMRATTSMVVGTVFSSIALFACGYSTLGWISAAAIGIFSVGEMLSSPKFLEFIGNMAPSDKKAMYLGFSQIPLAVGWTLEGKIGPMLYDKYSSKDRFSRELLIERISAGGGAVPAEQEIARIAEQAGAPLSELLALDQGSFEERLAGAVKLLKDNKLVSIEDAAEWGRVVSLAKNSDMPISELQGFLTDNTEQFVEGIPQGEAFDWLVTITGDAPRTLTDLMHSTHNVGVVWYIMGAVGLVSALGIWLYGRWVLTLKIRE